MKGDQEKQAHLTSEGHVGFVQVHLIAKCTLTLHSANVGFKLHTKLNGRGGLVMVAQMERTEGIQSARQLPLLAEIAPSE